MEAVEYINVFLKYISWWVIPILAMILYKRALSKYPIDAVIYEKRGEHLIKTNDVCGRFDDIVHCYKFKISKDTIQIPDYDWVLQCMYKPTNLFEKIINLLSGKIGSITLFKYSSKQYKPIQVRINTGEIRTVMKEVLDAKGQPVYVQIYEPINPAKALSSLRLEVIDWDDINHMTQELRAIASRRSPVQTFMEKWGHWMAFGLAIMALIIAGYYYKEMIMNAGARVESMSGTPSTSVPNNASMPDVPLIGDLLNK